MHAGDVCGFSTDLVFLKKVKYTKDFSNCNFSSAFFPPAERLCGFGFLFSLFLSPSFSRRRVTGPIVLHSVGVTAGRFVLLNDNEVRHEVKLLNTGCSLRTTSRMIPFPSLSLSAKHLFWFWNHPLLFSLLWVIGLTGSAPVLIQSHKHSATLLQPAAASAVYDALQGSVLGLVLFIIYTPNPGSLLHLSYRAFSPPGFFKTQWQ